MHLSLFGSTARGDQTPESDVDLMIEYDQQAKVRIGGASGISATFCGTPTTASMPK